jgi:hypothetical protein
MICRLLLLKNGLEHVIDYAAASRPLCLAFADMWRDAQWSVWMEFGRMVTP